MTVFTQQDQDAIYQHILEGIGDFDDDDPEVLALKANGIPI